MTRADCPHIHRVDAHFAGRISAQEEAEMRRHLLEGCAACQFRYTRLAMVAKVQPGAVKARERIAAGLGFGPRAFPWGRSLLFGLAAIAAMIAIVVLVRDRQDRFASRGSANAGVELRVFQVRAGKSLPVANQIAPTDELAFAYRDGTGKHHLFIFGVDEHRHVYWFSPAWRSAAERPAAPAIAGDGAFHEIEDAVAHPYDGARLDVYGLFTDRPWNVAELDAAISRGAPALSFPDGVLTVHHLAIAR